MLDKVAIAGIRFSESEAAKFTDKATQRKGQFQKFQREAINFRLIEIFLLTF